jgi:Aspartate ammonia-lyase
MSKRIEKDSIGEVEIDNDKYYGVNTVRAYNNFTVDVKKTDMEFIKQIARIKLAAATANEKLDRIDSQKANAIRRAAREIISGTMDDQFIVPEIQGGAGTSSNMNVNEVIANRGLTILGHNKGEYEYLSPQDDVNAGQSTNDDYPSAGKLTILVKAKRLDKSISLLIGKLDQKSQEFAKVKKWDGHNYKRLYQQH